METRATKRRAETTAQKQSQKKQRVVLAELPNLSNAIVPVNSNLGLEPQKPKCQKTKVKKTAATKRSLLLDDLKLDGTKVKAQFGADGNLDGPQNSEAYVSDINDYLRKMEVILLFIYLFQWNWVIVRHRGNDSLLCLSVN